MTPKEKLEQEFRKAEQAGVTNTQVYFAKRVTLEGLLGNEFKYQSIEFGVWANSPLEAVELVEKDIDNFVKREKLKKLNEDPLK